MKSAEQMAALSVDPPRAPAPPAALGHSFLETAPWIVHPLCQSMSQVEEEMGSRWDSISSRLPSMLARVPFANGWSASVVLFGRADNPGALFEIALISPDDGLRNESIMAYMDAEEANEVLVETAALPEFDASLRQALSKKNMAPALPTLRAAKKSGALAQFDGRVDNARLRLPSYAEEALERGRDGELDLVFARKAWLALARAGAALTAADFDSALCVAADSFPEDDPKRAQAINALAKSLFAPIFKADLAAGGSLAARVLSESSAEASRAAAMALARVESRVIDETAQSASPRKRAIGL